MLEIQSDKKVNDYITKFWIQRSHHSNISTIICVQNLFLKNSRNISLNSTYLQIFKNPRDRTSINILNRQSWPNKPKYLSSALDEATSIPFGFLFIDFHPLTDDSLRVRNFAFQKQDMKIFAPE